MTVRPPEREGFLLIGDRHGIDRIPFGPVAEKVVTSAKRPELTIRRKRAGSAA
ncbi:hypothetical protein [Desulfovibrio aminophilus]|uniref:hypothetical protein n=1 Tax=Desulfovibrio aminophilus TaxID=81425 RepID=UPI0033961F24